MNDVKLGDSHPATEELKPIKVGGESTALEVSKEDVRVNNLYVNGTTTGVAAIDDTKLPLAGGTMTGDIAVADGFVLDGAGDMVLDAAGGDIDIKNVGNTSMKLKVNASPAITLYEGAGFTDDYFKIATTSDAATIISTTDTAGSNGHFSIDIDGDITLNSETGVFNIEKSGTKFADMYAGMMLGYTRIQNNSTTSGDGGIYPTATMTVLQTAQGTDVSISFVVPPSGNVEIIFSGSWYGSSRTLELALSDNASFNEINETHTYDAGLQSSDETDRNMVVASWAVSGLTAGDSLTYYIAAAETVSGTSSFDHGRMRTTGTHYPPIIVKAIALPATIVTGE